MHIEYLSEFLTLVEYRNFTKAAAACNISQSTMSKHMDALQKELGVDLFRKDEGALLLTAAGRSFSESATGVCSQYEAGVEKARHIQARDEVQVTFGYCYSTSWWILDPLFVWVKQAKPNMNIKPVAVDFQETGLMLRQKSVDAVVALDVDKDFNKITSRYPLRGLHYVVVMRKDNPLAKKDRIRSSDLAKEALILPEASRYLEISQSIGRHIEHLPCYKNAMFLDEVDTLFHAVSAGMGIAIVLNHNIARYGDKLRFVEFDFDSGMGIEENRGPELCLFWLKELESSLVQQKK